MPPASRKGKEKAASIFAEEEQELIDINDIDMNDVESDEWIDEPDDDDRRSGSRPRTKRPAKDDFTDSAEVLSVSTKRKPGRPKGSKGKPKVAVEPYIPVAQEGEFPATAGFPPLICRLQRTLLCLALCV